MFQTGDRAIQLLYWPWMTLEFPLGLPGFEDHTRFELVERPGVAPIVFLQSVDSPDLCFLAAPVSAIDPAYELAMTPEDQALLENAHPLLCLAILSVAENGLFTANLLAPVVIDPESRQAVQAVRNDARYSHRHPLVSQCL